MNVKEEIGRLRQMKLEELVARYLEEYGKRPRVRHSREWLWKRLAWRLQEKVYGGLSETAKRRLEELISEIEIPVEERQRDVAGALMRPRKPGEPSPGSILEREWRGKTIRVEVLADGYRWNDQVFKSLSALARQVTGARWNGRLFFNLTQRKRKAK